MNAIALLEKAGEMLGLKKPSQSAESPADVGLWDLLTEEQIEAVTSYEGPDLVGKRKVASR